VKSATRRPQFRKARRSRASSVRFSVSKPGLRFARLVNFLTPMESYFVASINGCDGTGNTAGRSVPMRHGRLQRSWQAKRTLRRVGLLDHRGRTHRARTTEQLRRHSPHADDEWGAARLRRLIGGDGLNTRRSLGRIRVLAITEGRPLCGGNLHCNLQLTRNPTLHVAASGPRQFGATPPAYSGRVTDSTVPEVRRPLGGPPSSRKRAL